MRNLFYSWLAGAAIRKLSRRPAEEWSSCLWRKGCVLPVASLGGAFRPTGSGQPPPWLPLSVAGPLAGYPNHYPGSTVLLAAAQPGGGRLNMVPCKVAQANFSESSSTSSRAHGWSEGSSSSSSSSSTSSRSHDPTSRVSTSSEAPSKGSTSSPQLDDRERLRRLLGGVEDRTARRLLKLIGKKTPEKGPELSPSIIADALERALQLHKDFPTMDLESLLAPSIYFTQVEVLKAKTHRLRRLLPHTPLSGQLLKPQPKQQGLEPLPRLGKQDPEALLEPHPETISHHIKHMMAAFRSELGEPMPAYFILLPGLIRLLHVKPPTMKRRLSQLAAALGEEGAYSLIGTHPRVVFRDVAALLQRTEELMGVLQCDLVDALKLLLVQRKGMDWEQLLVADEWAHKVAAPLGVTQQELIGIVRKRPMLVTIPPDTLLEHHEMLAAFFKGADQVQLLDLVLLTQRLLKQPSIRQVQEQLDTITAILHKDAQRLLAVLLPGNGKQKERLMVEGVQGTRLLASENASAGHAQHASGGGTKEGRALYSFLMLPPPVLLERAQSLQQLLQVDSSGLVEVLDGNPTLLRSDPVSLKLKMDLLQPHLVEEKLQGTAEGQLAAAQVIIKCPQILNISHDTVTKRIKVLSSGLDLAPTCLKKLLWRCPLLLKEPSARLGRALEQLQELAGGRAQAAGLVTAQPWVLVALSRQTASRSEGSELGPRLEAIGAILGRPADSELLARCCCSPVATVLLQLSVGALSSRLHTLAELMGRSQARVMEMLLQQKTNYGHLLAMHPHRLRSTASLLADVLGLDGEQLSRLVGAAPAVLALKPETLSSRIDALAVAFGQCLEDQARVSSQEGELVKDVAGPSEYKEQRTLAGMAALAAALQATPQLLLVKPERVLARLQQLQWLSGLWGPWWLELQAGMQKGGVGRWLVAADTCVWRLHYMLEPAAVIQRTAATMGTSDPKPGERVPSMGTILRMQESRFHEAYPGFAAWQPRAASRLGPLLLQELTDSSTKLQQARWVILQSLASAALEDSETRSEPVSSHRRAAYKRTCTALKHNLPCLDEVELELGRPRQHVSSAALLKQTEAAGVSRATYLRAREALTKEGLIHTVREGYSWFWFLAWAESSQRMPTNAGKYSSTAQG